MKEFKMADILHLFKTIANVLKNNEDPVQRLLAICEAVAEFYEPESNNG